MTTAAAPPQLDPLDRTLLDRLQAGVPVCARPFDALGAVCGVGGDEVLARIRRLKEARVIRQIGAIFDTRSLGYESSLVAARVDPVRIEDAAAVVSAHPGVSHNYQRNHEFNLWYTIAVAPTSRLGLKQTVEILHRRSGAHSTRLLPTLRMFKIGVRFDMGDAPAADAGPAFGDDLRQPPQPLDAREIAFVRVFQRDLDLVPDPFTPLARELGISLDELAALHARFLATGRLRRFAAVLHHRAAGFTANAMGVWATPDDAAEIDRLGRLMAGFRTVSHCYRRPAYPDWPYHLFTMVHGRSRDECEATLAEIAAATGITNHLALYSTREFKKSRVRYFTPHEAEWERQQSLPI
jgi:DNA-binding Lrp family transcriptional regulator